jgi:TonB-dependent starch-binding outer membrane protein SusC
VQLRSEIAVDYLKETRRFVARTLDRGDGSQEIDFTSRGRTPSMTGIVVRQALAWNDRLFLDGGVRRDALDRDFVVLDDPAYPFASAAWDVVRAAPAGAGGLVSSLRLRGAYGESGDSRPYDAAIGAALTVPSDINDPSASSAVERTRETEAGFDLGLLGGRATVGATVFSRRTSDALIVGATPPGTGGSVTPISSVAAWRNRGTEVALRATLLDTRNVRADLSLIWTTLDNEITSLGNNPTQVATSYRLAKGYPLYGAWGQRFTVSDVNGDGVIVPAEVVADTGARYLGSPVPTREVGVSPSLVLGRTVTLTATVDHRGGFRSVNSGGRLRCNSVCGDLYLPNVSLADQARAVNPSVATAAWVEDASFVKLRELAVAWTLPGAWARAIGARTSSVTLSGRNLLTRTDYTGLDPEVTFTGQTRIDQAELFTLPLPRTFSLRLDARW